ncbi:MAG TPA: 50S ribosomal protein L28 [Patescibacteria group bacterium]|nr:50S ribosomal protein L28 [Patescibacteria group bacterium]
MAFKCDNCGKGLSWGHRVSHAKNRTNHAFRPNIQKKRIEVDGVMRSFKLCTNCIKTLKKPMKTKAPKEEVATPMATA